MKYFLIAAFLLMATTVADADTWVNGYYKNDGTYVEGHYRSDPDGNPYNNWSSKGNVNPYTGKPGTKDPDKSWNTDPDNFDWNN